MLRSGRNLKVAIIWYLSVFTYVIERSFSLTSTMKRIYKKVFKSKKPSLGSIHGPGPANSTSSVTSDATASAQVTAGVSVSVQLCPSRL
jgi:hypothetical protein